MLLRFVHAAALPLAALLLAAAPACSPARQQPDVILISVDTLRADHLGAYGYARAKTPSFDALARRGRLFTQATTPIPRTTPALASLLTGLWPQNHGSREVGSPMTAGASLAEVLAARGWTTAGISANSAAGAVQRLNRGFERFLDKQDLENTRSTQVTDRALELVAQAPARKPLFLWVHYTDPHYTYKPPREFDPGPAAEPCRALMEEVKSQRVSKGALQTNRGGVTSAALPACVLLYDAEIAYADSQIGRLLDGLRDAGRLERAFVVFTADHGENLGEAGVYLEHGPSVHDASLRVPLVIAGPGVAPGVDEGVARLEDLAPTLLALLGVPEAERPRTDGADLSMRVRGRADDGAAVAFAESANAFHVEYTALPFSGRIDARHCYNRERWSLCAAPDGATALYDHVADPELTRDVAGEHPDVARALREAGERWRPDQLRERAVRTPRWKLVDHPRLDGEPRRALYDLTADPGETRDVSAEHPQVAAELGALLERWSESLAASPVPAPGETDIEALRALGYVD